MLKFAALSSSSRRKREACQPSAAAWLSRSETGRERPSVGGLVSAPGDDRGETAGHPEAQAKKPLSGTTAGRRDGSDSAETRRAGCRVPCCGVRGRRSARHRNCARSGRRECRSTKRCGPLHGKPVARERRTPSIPAARPHRRRCGIRGFGSRSASRARRARDSSAPRFAGRCRESSGC